MEWDASLIRIRGSAGVIGGDWVRGHDQGRPGAAGERRCRDSGGPEGSPLHLSPVTVRSGYLRAEELVDEYGAQSDLDLRCLPWYQTLAMWKAAIFCEAIYAR